MNPTELALIATAILGPTGVVGILKLFSNRDKPVTKADVPPTVDPQVGLLTNQVTALTGLLGDLASRVDQLEMERDHAQREAAHSAALAEQSERVKALAVTHIIELRQHINERKSPPPPEYPPGLFY